MSLLRRLIFDLQYLGRPPWDNGIVPPEVREFIASHPAGRALDLGCGTGTSSLALAEAGWTVTGVDFVPRAIKAAKRKAKNANASAEFFVADVIHLPSSLFSIPYSLVLDIGCFHSLAPASKIAYLDQLDRLLAPDGVWLMYGFLDAGSGTGLSAQELETIAKQFKLLRRENGTERNLRPSAWFWWQKA